MSMATDLKLEKSNCEQAIMEEISSNAVPSSSALHNSTTEFSGQIDGKCLSSDNLSNDSSDLKCNSSKGRVVASKYKSASIEVARKGKLALENINPSLSRSNSIDAKSREKSSVKPKNGPPQRRVLHSADYLLPNKQLPKKGAQSQKFLSRDAIKPNPKLHSTAVNNSTFFEKTIYGSDIFSTTVVGGKLQRNFPSLAELPDISTISPGNANPSGSSFEGIGLHDELPAVSESLENASANLVDEPNDYTKEEIAAEYLRYLTWALVDIDSEDKYQQQMAEAEKQVAFLTNLVEGQQECLLDNQKSLALIEHYEKVCKDHQSLKELLRKLEDSLEPCSNQLDLLTSNLEMQVNKICMENVYIPTDHIHFEDELRSVLDENCNLLSQINSELEPERTRNEALVDLSNDIIVCIDTARPCIAELDQLASIAIQESSLAFTIDKINEIAAKDGE